MTDAERDRTGTQKAKDWDRLEIFYKIHRVEAPKVHALKLGHGQRSIYDEDMLMIPGRESGFAATAPRISPHVSTEITG